MLEPKTYYGYNEKDEHIASKTATDAKKDIDPNEIKTKAENAENVANQSMEGISASLDSLINDVDNALIVQGKSMKADVDIAIESIGSTKSNIISSINSGELYSKAVEKHDELQKKYNEEAYGIVAKAKDVTRVESRG